MASLSLPRVLQLRKNSLDAEREQFEKFQTLAIQKAINSIETPVKEKHVRSTIIGTFQEQSAVTYWMVAVRLPLQDNRIVSWKFCHVTHKLLREGHPACLDDSQRHINMIENLGKLWVHLREGYGRLISLYCKLLVTKLKFHSRNPRFPGNMQLTVEELDAIAENDVNNYFQLCVELFDYMDDILQLQAAVFDSLGNARANSMTASGQCRLAALIPCAQDSSHIYDCIVRQMFRLHASLPPDVLDGHRERFRTQFKKLSSFYKHASSLQYYRNLLTLPVLPSNPPNFLQQSDFGTYVTPVVTIPELPPDEVDAVGSLIDTSDPVTQSQMHSEVSDTRSTNSPVPDPIVERDRLIEHLQHELKRMRSEVSQIIQERNTMLGSMREHCTRLEAQMQNVKSELDDERNKAESLAAETPEIKKKLMDTEDKAKVIDEKFQKLKGAYTQLREEHITLIRQKAEVDKLASKLRGEAAQHEGATSLLQQQLNDRMKDVELLQQKASSSEEVEAYKTELTNLRTELELTRQKEVELQTLRTNFEALEIEHNTVKTVQQDKLTALTNDLKETNESLEKLKADFEEKDKELSRVKEELTAVLQKSGDEYKTAIKDKEEALKQLAEMKAQYQEEREERIIQTNNLQAELEYFKAKLTDTQNDFDSQCRKLNGELNSKNEELQAILDKKDAEANEAIDKVSLLQKQIENYRNDIETSKATIDKQNEEIDKLNNKINTLEEDKENSMIEFENMNTLNNMLDEQLQQETHKRNLLDKEISEKIVEVTRLEENIEELKTEYESRLRSKDDDIETLRTDIEKLFVERDETLHERNNLLSINQGLQKSIKELQNKENELTAEIEKARRENVTVRNTLQSEIDNLRSACVTMEISRDNVARELTDEFGLKEVELKRVIADKDAVLATANKDLETLKTEVARLTEIQTEERQALTRSMSEREKNIQLTEARLEHTESERLTAECELQDLLQQNTIMEADLMSLKIQLDEKDQLIKKQASKILACATEAALDITNEAISAFENSNAQDTNKRAGEHAAKAFETIARKHKLEGNEELVSRSVLSAAHNTARVSYIVSDVTNTTTDMELAEKLSNDCRTMLANTKQCLENISTGAIDVTQCLATGASVTRLSRAAADDVTDTRGVDDELADMDRAIEVAAKQIEDMLAASRAGDTGVKLEVNGKILDACTTLMAAVKVLVQDSRNLQNELGDPKTRQNMYRRNPQWSEGLISASKAVVFAAKLLVSSADEAVGAAGRVEGVSAAAHEVAGSTAQLVAASRAKAPPATPALARLTAASRAVAAATGAVVAAVRGASALVRDQETLDTSNLSLTATRRLEMESKVRALELESALDAERNRLAALRKRHYNLAQMHENGTITNGDE
ncbi:huntingtin-interacting protein 1 isoform X1 [Danaus plexippus]|uniref:huntingtin-interacting protein 1 isoform X1 n=1 Tax=Danaus plexippus TaxID=13037 RepID=UPI002AB2FABA|nr:huntingtin-interacting protein 1 isoform X1 [Danaus plexippus]